MPTTLRLWITIDLEDSMPAVIEPIHPGEVLKEEFLAPLALSQNALARAISVPPRRINEIVLGKRSISADTALRLSRYFETTPEFWMNLQSQFDLESARDRLGDKLAKEVHRRG